MMDIGQIHLDILIGLGLPALGAMVFVIRHFWLKTKCFYLMKQRLEQLELETERGREAHQKIFEALTELREDTHRIMGKLEMRP